MMIRGSTTAVSISTHQAQDAAERLHVVNRLRGGSDGCRGGDLDLGNGGILGHLGVLRCFA